MREGIDCLFHLALKNNELNMLALKKDNEKYGYTKEILNENLKNKTENKEQNKIFDIFTESLYDIEKLSEDNNSKEETVNNIQKKLFSEKK